MTDTNIPNDENDLDAGDSSDPSLLDSLSDGQQIQYEGPTAELDYGVVAQQGPDAQFENPIISSGVGEDAQFENPIISRGVGEDAQFENPIISNLAGEDAQFENPIISRREPGKDLDYGVVAQKDPSKELDYGVVAKKDPKRGVFPSIVGYGDDVELEAVSPSIVGLEQDGIHSTAVFPSIVGLIAIIALLLLGGVGGYLMLTGGCLPLIPCDAESALTGPGNTEEVLVSTEVPPVEPAAGSDDDSPASDESDQSGAGSQEMDSETEIVEMATEEPASVPDTTTVNNPPPPPPPAGDSGGEEPASGLCADNDGVQWQGETCVCAGFVDVVTICNDGAKIDNVTSTVCTPDPNACAAGGGGGGGDEGGGGGSCQPPSGGCPSGQDWIPWQCACDVIN